MHPVHVIPVPTDRESLKKYINFGIDLYKDNPYYVPPLVMDDIATLSPHSNPAFDFCEAQSFMALRNGETVGTITAIINKKFNEKVDRRQVRFGFMDFIDDAEVVDALFAAVEKWGAERGMNEIVGPLGFTDMDREGMLIDGFEEVGTMATIYNYPYYPKHMDRMGFVKENDWIEFRMPVPDGIPEKYVRVAEIVQRKYGLKVLEYKSIQKLKKDYGRAIFDLINETYSHLYGFTQLTERQIEHYIDIYIGIVRLQDICLITDAAGKLICLGIAMPSLSKALQKSRGRLFPFGWWPLLRALRGHTDVVDLLLVAVAPEYQNKGVNALLFNKLIPSFKASGYKFAESNVEMEDNDRVQKQWEAFERRQHRRRRAYIKNINEQ